MVVNIFVCHGSIPGRGVLRLFQRLGRLDWQLPSARAAGPNYFSASQHGAGVFMKEVWHNGSASDSRSEAWEFDLSW
jgi:hypothetical protein